MTSRHVVQNAGLGLGFESQPDSDPSAHCASVVEVLRREHRTGWTVLRSAEISLWSGRPSPRQVLPRRLTREHLLTLVPRWKDPVPYRRKTHSSGAGRVPYGTHA